LKEVRIDVDSSKFIAFTNADGTYSISGIPAGTHNIRMSLPGKVGIIRSNYVLDGNKVFDICLVDTLQESPGGNLVLKLDEFRELPPFTTYKGLNLVREGYENGPTWYRITEGNLIPVYLANATHYDSTQFISAIGTCNGNWQSSQVGSVEKEQKRNLFILTNDPQIGYTKRGIYVKFNASSTNTIIGGSKVIDNYSYIDGVLVNLRSNGIETIQKEVFGRALNKGEVSVAYRLSYMNSSSAGVTNLDHMHNIVFYNHWAAIGRNEQKATIFDMENTPVFNIPAPTIITKPLDNAIDLEQNVQIMFQNKFGTDWYRLQVSDKEDFSRILKDLKVSRTDTILVFDKGKEYFIKVTPVNTKGSASSSNVVSFKTKAAINNPPSTFTILTPLNNQTVAYVNGKLEISSSPATDIDLDPLTKKYRVLGPNLDTLIYRDNNTKIDLDSARFTLDSEYQIFAEVSDGIVITQASNNPVRFRTPKPNGIEDPIYKNFKAYPIPVRDYLNIEYDPNTRGTRRIISMDGKVLDSKKINGETSESVDMTKFKAGMYILQLNQKTIRIFTN
jgi:hypothetical protein